MRRALAGILIGLSAALLVLLADLALSAFASGINPFLAIELRTYDWRLTRTAQPSTARQDIALVEIDEYSLKNLEPETGRWPWPRAWHSLILDFLARGPARVVGYDVVFAGADAQKEISILGQTLSGAESDTALIDSVRSMGSVIMIADATYEGETATGALKPNGFTLAPAGFIERRTLFPPFGALAEAASGIAHNLFILDPDAPLRHTVPFVRSGDTLVPSLGLAVALRAAGMAPGAVRMDGSQLSIGDRVMPLVTRQTQNAEGAQTYWWGLVNFRGPAFLEDMTRRPYPNYSAFDLISSEIELLNGRTPKIDPALFKEKIVFVGTTATGLFDVFETPFAQGKMPGIQVNAAIVDDILSNRFLTEGGARSRVAVVITSALLIGVVSVWLPAWWASAVAATGLIVLGWIATRLFAAGYWLNLSQPVLASSIALFGGVAYQYFVEGREKRKMKRLFGQYVSKDVFEQLTAHPELAQLGGHRREMTVLFSDIRGFTTVTERGQPEETVRMLNEYFTKMVECVFARKGTLDKFVGDMVMALFGAPLDDPHHADHAVEAALDMIAELRALNVRWKAEGRYAELDIGIGINTGPMIAGNIGSDAIMSYTVIGDAVNLGSRLESLNKQYGTRIIISEATKGQLTGRYLFRPLGDVVVKGKTKPVAIFELIGRDDGQAEPAGQPSQTHEAHL